MPELTAFVENPENGRLYEVVTVDGFPVDDDGNPCECVRIDDEQRIELARTSLNTGRRADLIIEALGMPTRTVAWRLVRVAGRTKPGPVVA